MTRHAFTRWLGRSLIPNIGTLLLVALMFAYQQATAQTGTTPPASTLVTNTFAYQGFLTTTAGQPVHGTRALTFRLYSGASGGTALWAEVRNTVAVQDGLFNVRLGEIIPIPASLWENTTLYLGVQVEAESELIPREPIGLIPVAQRAIIADNATQADLALTVPDASITSEKLKPTLTFIPAPAIALPVTGEYQSILTTTVTVDVPSRIWIIPVIDGRITQGSLIGRIFLDDQEMTMAHTIIEGIGSTEVTVRASASATYILDLTPGTHEIVLKAFGGPGTGTIFGHNTGLSYMIVSQ